MNGFKMELPSDVTFIIDKMHSHGFSAHVVGGSVRDSLIGRELGDFDITTNALPAETKAVFSEYRTVDTGIKHGTVTLVLGGVPYEITTYRIDGDYKDKRHPHSVTFTASLKEDLARRDFTVNAMAYSDRDGLIDPFDGCGDAEKKLIRAVGDPMVRFSEDALRILRALRFSSVLGFDIEGRTQEAARALSKNLGAISKERVYTELKKLISGADAHTVMKKYADIIASVFGGVRVEGLPEKALFDRADYLTRLASVFYLNSLEPVECAERVLLALKTDKFTRTHTISVLSAYNHVSFSSEREALYALAKYGKDITEGALRLGILLGKFSEADTEILSYATASGKPYMISHLSVRGTDLASLGICGEKIGETLSSLLFAVIDGRVENEKNALVEYASGIK